MNLSYKSKDRRVVPNWRYFDKTLASGELDNWKVACPSMASFPIDDYVSLWKEHQSLYRAGDLLSAGITNNSMDNASVQEAASFILERESISTKSLVRSAKRVLGVDFSSNSQSVIESERLRECTALDDIRSYIHGIRQRLNLMPYNPFLYVDLSRAYLLLGQNDKAEEAITQALHYGATNRFVARSAARFYLHKEDKDKAYEAIRAQGAVSIDPWLMAAEISISMLRGKTSNYIKKGISFIESGNCSPFGFTELASAIGTLEWTAGARRNSNRLFRKSLIQPNDNSLAQVQWINSFDSQSLNVDVPVHFDYEVRTIEAVAKGDYSRARHEAVSWVCDMPFSHKPINLGSRICALYLHDFALAADILDVGLRSDNTNASLLNNKAYCAARDNQIEAAKDAFIKLIQSTRSNESPELKACIPATEGLILYRSNKINEAALKYQEAVAIAKHSGDDGLYKKAMLNYCRERLIAGDGNIEEVWLEAESLEIGKDEFELIVLLDEVKTEYLKHKS